MFHRAGVSVKETPSHRTFSFCAVKYSRAFVIEHKKRETSKESKWRGGVPELTTFCSRTTQCFLSKRLRNRRYHSTPLFTAIIHRYGDASGQAINVDKSSITFSKRTPPELKTKIKEVLSIQKEGGVRKYLGLPEHFGRSKRDLFSSIVDRIRQKASSWSTRYLSTAGKVVLIQRRLVSCTFSRDDMLRTSCFLV